MRRTHLSFGTILIASILMHRDARADDALPVSVDYTAPAACPDRGAFVERIAARAPRAQLDADTTAAHSLVARIEASPKGGFAGALVVRDEEGAPAERTVHAQTCADVVTALAIIAAVAIDRLPLPPKSEREAIADPRPDGSTSDTRSGESWPVEEPVPPAPPPVAERWRKSGGANVGMVVGSAPAPLVDLPLFFELSHAFGGIVEPAMRLRFGRSTVGASRRAMTGRGGRFVRTGGAMDLCPIAIRARLLRLQPCARAELAALYAKGLDVAPAQGHVRPWVGLGAIARMRLDVGGPFFVEVEGGAAISVIRDRFYVEPSIAVFRPPPVSGSVASGVGLSF